VGLNALTQAERLELCFFQRLYLVHLELPGKTLYLSDRNYTYNYGSVQNYENYLFDLSALAVETARIGAKLNQKITLTFRNDRILSADSLIELNDTYRFCFAYVRIYELRLMSLDETFSSDVKVLVYCGYCGQPYDITRRGFKIDCQNVMLAKRDLLPVKVVTTAMDANADPDDLGKFRNTVYGSVSHVPCRCVKAGAKDSLAADLTDSATTVTASGATKISFPSSGTIQIDDEQITYTGFSSNQFTGCTRGANSTTATEHDTGSSICQVLSEYIYEIAMHPVRTISAVYVDGVLQSSGFTTYTGQTGYELSGYSGRAVVRFTVLPVIRKQVNLDVSEGSHDHGFSGTSQTTRYGTGNTGDSTWTDRAQAYDGNSDTYAENSDLDAAEYINITFTETNLGTVISRRVIIEYLSNGTTSEVVAQVKIGTAAYQVLYGTGGTRITVMKTFTGNSWDLDVRINGDGDNNGTFRLYEVSVTVEYTPDVAANAATGVALTGNSSADTVIGQLVTATIEGYQDDASGTYTGVANALIERPNAVIKHILMTLLGVSGSNIGTSFPTSGTSYGSTYKLGFIMHEIATKADDLLQKLAFQARSKFLEWCGKFELIYMGSAPSPSVTFTSDDLLEEPVLGFTAEIDIRNRIFARYKRDYRKSGGDEGYDAVESAGDSTSISLNGERMENVDLSACRTQAMAADWAAWYLAQKKQEWKTIEITVPWAGKALNAGETFSLTWDLWTGLTWDLVAAETDHMAERVRLTGQQWPS
jgi:hypothetical protein